MPIPEARQDDRSNVYLTTWWDQIQAIPPHKNDILSPPPLLLLSSAQYHLSD